MKLKFSDILIVLAIVINLFLLAYTRYLAVSQAQLNALATTISQQPVSSQLLQDGLLIGSLWLSGMVLGVGTSLYLYLRSAKENWLVLNFAYMFFVVMLILDLAILGIGVPF